MNGHVLYPDDHLALLLPRRDERGAHIQIESTGSRYELVMRATRQVGDESPLAWLERERSAMKAGSALHRFAHSAGKEQHCWPVGNKEILSDVYYKHASFFLYPKDVDCLRSLPGLNRLRVPGAISCGLEAEIRKTAPDV